MEGRIEYHPGLFETRDQHLGQRQVPRGGHRKELRQTLEDPQKRGLPQRHPRALGQLDKLCSSR